ncbi:MAG: hypothetical protein RSB78_00715 [Oscillospiraceae bacterium]
MDIVKGSAVVSKAGRDKGRFFAVLELDSDFAMIADGDLRKIDKPKRKKLRHLGATSTIFTQHVLSSDKLLYADIKSRFYSDIPSREG